MNKKRALPIIVERGLPILAYIFPLMETLYFFSTRVFLYTDNVDLKIFFLKYIQGIVLIYQNNIYASFFLSVAVFSTCSRNALPLTNTPLPLTKFMRLNIIQAILIEIAITCVGQIFLLSPSIIKNGLLGTLISNGCFMGVFLLILYSSFLIMLGRVPRLPIITQSARFNVQRGWLSD